MVAQDDLERHVPPVVVTNPSRTSATDKAPLIIITTILLSSFSLCVIIMRFVVKLAGSIRMSSVDDYLLVISGVFAIIQSMVTAVARAGNGFAKPSHQLSMDSLQKCLKAELAATILYICSLSTAKLSSVAMLLSITPSRSQRRALYAVSTAIVTWAVASVLITSFQCEIPRTWDYANGAKCINRTAWWSAFDVLNILTEVPLVIIPMCIVYKVQLRTVHKLQFLVPFWGRIATIAACITNIWVWRALIHSSSDPFFAEWQSSVCIQVIQCCCLTTSCAMFLKRFLKMLQTGFALEGDLRTSVPVELQTFSILDTSQEPLTPAQPVFDYSTLASRSRYYNDKAKRPR